MSIGVGGGDKWRVEASLGSLMLKFAGYEFASATDWHDANWLVVRVSLVHDATSVIFSGPYCMTSDMLGLADGCDALLAGEVNSVEFAPLEPNIFFSITRSDGLGHFTVDVELQPDTSQASVRVTYQVDQTQIRDLSNQSKAVLECFPVRN